MSTSEDVKKELKALLDKQDDLVDLAGDNKDILRFGTTYQHWYSQAYKLVDSLASERLGEFVSYYLIDPKRKLTDAGNYVLQDYIKGIGARTNHLNEPLWDTNSIAIVRVLNQIQILASLSTRIDSVLQDVTGHLFAGVVLERHLQRAAKNHKISIRKKAPTISDLNDPLKQAGVYDVPMWRKIQLLADIRNLCSHQKSTEPTDEQVEELIAGVNSVIKSVF